VLRAAEALLASRPDAQFLVPLATRPTRDRFEAAIYRLGLDKLPLKILYGHATDALRAADVALVASGTATLQAALARCPHIIFYRIHRLTEHIVRARMLLPYVGLPNILAGRFVVPEMLQDDATPENLALAAANLFDDTVTRRRLEALFAGFAASLAADTGALSAMPSLRSCALQVSHADPDSREPVAGIDEAGRGPLAGPVVAAAVILDPQRPIRGLRDSKLLNEQQRDDLAAQIRVRPLRGPSARPTCSRSTVSTSCRRRCWRCGGRSSGCRSLRSRPGSMATAARRFAARCGPLSKAIAMWR
jgi:hypothetical protein